MTINCLQLHVTKHLILLNGHVLHMSLYVFVCRFACEVHIKRIQWADCAKYDVFLICHSISSNVVSLISLALFSVQIKSIEKSRPPSLLYAFAPLQWFIYKCFFHLQFFCVCECAFEFMACFVFKFYMIFLLSRYGHYILSLDIFITFYVTTENFAYVKNSLISPRIIHKFSSYYTIVCSMGTQIHIRLERLKKILKHKLATK